MEDKEYKQTKKHQTSFRYPEFNPGSLLLLKIVLSLSFPID